MGQGTFIDFIKLSLDINNTELLAPNQLGVIAGLMVPDFSIFFAYLAPTMSNRMRGVLYKDALLVVGTMDEQTLLDVQWVWLVLPPVVTGCTCIFLGLVIWMSEQQGVKAWKTSVLAKLFHGVDPELSTSSQMGSKKLLSEMEMVAEVTSVQLDHRLSHEGGLMLRKMPSKIPYSQVEDVGADCRDYLM